MGEHGPLPVDTGRGLSLWYRGRSIYSRHDPSAAPVKAALAAVDSAGTLYLVPSPCLCHGLGELAGRMKEGSAILCVETDQELMALAVEASRDLRSAHPGLALIRSDDLRAAVDWARGMGSFRRVELVRLSGGYDLDRPFYDALLSALVAEVALGLRNRVTLVRMGRLWARNLVRNLGSLPWEDAVRPLPDNSAVAVCGAGPSLDAALPFLLRNAGRLHVMACDTACGPLAAAGVPVDSIVCLEGQVYNLADFLPMEGRRARLCVDLSAHPSSFRALSGPKLLLASAWDDSGLHGRLAAAGLPILGVPPLGSVGVLALHLARVLHGGPILFAGLDFGFEPGRTHCSGSPVELAEARRESRLYRRDGRWAATFRPGVRTLAGGALCDPALSMYAGLAAEELERAGSGGRVTVDLRTGARHPLPAAAAGFTAAERILAGCPVAGRPAVAEPGAPGEAAEWRRRAEGFLETEARVMGELRGALRDGCDRERLSGLVTRADWSFSHFPDPERVRALELDALRRLAAEAGYWEGLLSARREPGSP